MSVAKFSYTAQKSDGEVYNGTAEARDRFELYDVVRREGGRIMSLTEERARGSLTLSYWNAKISTVPEYEKVLFARNIGAMLGAGLSLARALAILERQTRNARLREVVSELSGAVRRGETLHSALAHFPNVFSRLFVAMVRAGEEGGELSQSLGVVSDQMERMYVLKKKIRGALLYPAIIVIAIIGVGIFMMLNVVPTLSQTFSEMGAELPASTRAIIAVSDFLVHYSIVAISGAVLFLGSIYGFARTPIGSRIKDFIFLHIPIIGAIVREVNAARTSRTLASLLAAGVDVLSSLDIVADVVQNSYFKAVIVRAKEGVGKGEPLSAAFVRNEHLYPPFVGEMMSVGEETGQLTAMMKKMATYYEDEVDRKTKDMSTVIEPFLMVAIGGAVGFFAVAMISPIYQLSENI
jgi:type IV pilus assembly protein PilC